MAYLLAEDVTATTRCSSCGGYGHAASQTLPDGTEVSCATKVLGNKVPDDKKGTKPKDYNRDVVIQQSCCIALYSCIAVSRCIVLYRAVSPKRYSKAVAARVGNYTAEMCCITCCIAVIQHGKRYSRSLLYRRCIVSSFQKRYLSLSITDVYLPAHAPTAPHARTAVGGPMPRARSHSLSISYDMSYC